MHLFRLAALAFVASAALASSASAFVDNVSITGSLDAPDGAEYYELVGQSAYIQYRTSSSTSGNHLDLIQSGGFGIAYAEIFPETNLTDYLTFGYFGIVNTHGSSRALNVIADTSLVVAMQPGIGEGQTFDSFNTPGYDEATLVAAMTGGDDSAEFLAVLESYSDNASLLGTIGLPQEAIVGDTLDLIAFIGGPNGDLGVKIGELSTSITREVPAPGAPALLAIAGCIGIRRRR